MPGMDGPTLLRELRRRQPDLKIIFISGYAEDAFQRHLAEGRELPVPAEAVLAEGAGDDGEGDAGGVVSQDWRKLGVLDDGSEVRSKAQDPSSSHA